MRSRRDTWLRSGCAVGIGSPPTNSVTAFGKSSFMKGLLLTVLSLFALTVNAQTVQIGSGTTTTSAGSGTIPVTNYVYSYSQQLVTAAEFTAGGGPSSGNIVTLRYFFPAIGTTTVWNNWTVYMGNTAKTSFGTTTDWVPTGSMTQVFSGLITPVAGAWTEITLTVPFAYTGGNIVIAVDENALNWTTAPSIGTYASTANSGIMYRSDSTNPNPVTPPTASSRTGTLPRIQFQLPEACPTPNTLNATNVTGNGADLSWASAGSLFDLQWGTSGFALGTGTTINGITGTTQSLGGLAFNTAYQYYVRQDCGSGVYSNWAGPYTFTTTVACPSPTALAVSNRASTSATISWTSPGTLFDVENALT